MNENRLISPAIALLEFDSIAAGVRAADAMVKKSPVDSFRAGTVHAGKYLVLVGGSVAVVEEAHREGLALGGEHVTDHILLPAVNEQVSAALTGARRENTGDALGVLETSAIPINVGAADRAIKAAQIDIVEIRMGDGLGGKAILFFSGLIHDVEAGMAAAEAFARRDGIIAHTSIISLQHGDLRGAIALSTHFTARDR